MRIASSECGSCLIPSRVEFRVLEAQLTDFENAAYVVFVVLLTRVIAAFQLNFYMPLSKVPETEANMNAFDLTINDRLMLI